MRNYKKKSIENVENLFNSKNFNTIKVIHYYK